MGGQNRPFCKRNRLYKQLGKKSVAAGRSPRNPCGGRISVCGKGENGTRMDGAGGKLCNDVAPSAAGFCSPVRLHADSGHGLKRGAGCRKPGYPDIYQVAERRCGFPEKNLRDTYRDGAGRGQDPGGCHWNRNQCKYGMVSGGASGSSPTSSNASLS